MTSLFQSVTSVQEPTLTFAPKLIAFAGLVLLLAPWLLRVLGEFTISTLHPHGFAGALSRAPVFRDPPPAMTLGYLLTWMMVFLRAVGVVMLMPQMAGRSAPIMVRLGLATCMATLLAGVVPPATMPRDYLGLILPSAGEVGLGLALGFVGQLAFQAVDFAGRLISSEVGPLGRAGPARGRPGVRAAVVLPLLLRRGALLPVRRPPGGPGRLRAELQPGPAGRRPPGCRARGRCSSSPRAA